MSNFIVPLTGLPSISSIQSAAGSGKANVVSEKVPFANVLQEAVQNLAGTAANSQASTYDLAVNGSDDLHTGAINAVKYNTAVSFTSGMVSAVIRAYNELMRMAI